MPLPTASDRRLWCSASRRSEAVGMIDAVKLPAVMRPKLEIPLAEGRRSGGMRPNEIVSIKQSGGIALYAI